MNIVTRGSKKKEFISFENPVEQSFADIADYLDSIHVLKTDIITYS